MITRQEFEGMLTAFMAVGKRRESARVHFAGYIMGVCKALLPEPDSSIDVGYFTESPERINELLDRLFPRVPEPSAPMEREAPYQIEVGGFGEKDVLLARAYLLQEIGGFDIPAGIKVRLLNLLEMEAERQKFLAWLEDECDEMSKVPKDIPGLSEYLDKWLCR